MSVFRGLASIMALSTIIWTVLILVFRMDDGTVFSYFIGASGGFSAVAIVAAAKRLRDEMAAISAASSSGDGGQRQMNTESLIIEIALYAVSMLIGLMWVNYWVG